MTGGAANLKPLVMSCLVDEARNRPPVTQVSRDVKRTKDMCSCQTGHDGMSPIVWWAEDLRYLVSHHLNNRYYSNVCVFFKKLCIKFRNICTV